METRVAALGLEDAYELGHASALVVHHPDPGIVRIDGKDRLDFLQRMSTNAIAGQPPGKVIPTVLTTPLARIVDLVWVLTRPDHVLLLTGPERGPAVLDWLRRYIFFQDDVRVSLADHPVLLLGYYGPAFAAAVHEAWPDLPVPAIGTVSAAEGQMAWAVSRPALTGVRILVRPDVRRPPDSLPPIEANLGAYTALRIEAGIPEHGAEITPEAIPLEVGLEGAISTTKGCYIGQEIIARMQTRGRRARTLAGVRLADEAPAGATLLQDGTAVGRLTSVGRSPRRGWIALAMVRPTALTDHAGIVSAGDARVEGRLVELPMD